MNHHLLSAFFILIPFILCSGLRRRLCRLCLLCRTLLCSAHIVHGNAQLLHQRFCCLIGLRMHTGGIKRILSILNAQETGALFICLRPELCHFQKLAPALESAVCFPVIHNVLCNHLADSGNIFQKRR